MPLRGGHRGGNGLRTRWSRHSRAGQRSARPPKEAALQRLRSSAPQTAMAALEGNPVDLVDRLAEPGFSPGMLWTFTSVGGYKDCALDGADGRPPAHDLCSRSANRDAKRFIAPRRHSIALRRQRVALQMQQVPRAVQMAGRREHSTPLHMEPVSLPTKPASLRMQRVPLQVQSVGLRVELTPLQHQSVRLANQ